MENSELVKLVNKIPSLGSSIKRLAVNFIEDQRAYIPTPKERLYKKLILTALTYAALC